MSLLDCIHEHYFIFVGCYYDGLELYLIDDS